MGDINALLEQLQTQRPVSWEQLPDFALYMDQVLSYMDRQFIRFDGEDALTAAMVNNYTKSGLVPRADGKKYNREHLAYLTVVGILKHVLSARDMDLMIKEELQGLQSVETGYAAFQESLDCALRATAEEIQKIPEEESVAEKAFHFALLSYASGVACSRYISMLRDQKGEATAKPVKRKKEKEQEEYA